MIPNNNVNIDLVTFEVEAQPSLTYALDVTANRIRGSTDGRESVKQAIYLILSAERYEYLIFSWNYGAELKNLIGQPIALVLPEIKRLIGEALLQDDRITEVDNFDFVTTRNSVHVTFTAHSIYGDIDTETEVNF